jgi:ATP-dependent protease ClpP protease subunit
MNQSSSTTPAIIPGQTIYITVNTGINDNAVNKLTLMCTNLMAHAKPKCLYFLFSSFGGGVDPAIAFYNFLRALPVDVVMHNISMVASSATAIFHAADVRYSSPGATFHFHGLTWTFGAQETINRARLGEIQSMLNEGEKRMAELVCKNCKLTEKMLWEMFEQGKSRDNAYALEHGIIQEIREPKIPADAISLTFTVD